MTRLLGFLSGLLVVIALAVVAVRYPPAGLFTPEPAPEVAAEVVSEIATQATDTTVAEAVAAPSAPEAPAEETPQQLERVDDVPPAAVGGEHADDDGSSDTDDTRVASAKSKTDVSITDETIPHEAITEGATRQWHTFWQPFHSELSAQGFRRRLEGVTGLDYRVVSPQPGEYQVAFAYRNESERLENLAAIEAATGLVLRSGML